MRAKNLQVMALSAGIAVLLAGAVAQGEPTALDAHALGVTEGILNYCAGVDPAAAAKLHEKVKAMLHGSTAAAVAGTRASAAYRTAYDSVTNFVSKVEKPNAARPCSAALATIARSDP